MESSKQLSQCLSLNRGEKSCWVSQSWSQEGKPSMPLSLAVTPPWELHHGWENSGVLHCVPVGQLSSSHGMAWLEILSAGDLHSHAAFCASSLVHPWRFLLGLQSFWDSKKKLENMEKGEEEESSQSPRVFPGRNTE